MAMELPTEGRARLAELLVESLDPAELVSIERQWALEARGNTAVVRRLDTEMRCNSFTTWASPMAITQMHHL
jgi:hypothetical protein